MTQSHFFRPADFSRGGLTLLRSGGGNARIVRVMISLRRLIPAAALAFAFTAGTSCDRKPDVPQVDVYNIEGNVAWVDGRYADALAAYQKALALTDKDKDPKEWARIASDVAKMHGKLAAWKEAETLLIEVLRLREQYDGAKSVKTAENLDQLAKVLMGTGRHKEAEPLLRRVLAIDEGNGGKDTAVVALRLKDLAQLLQEMNRLDEAEPLMRQAVEIYAGVILKTRSKPVYLETLPDNYRDLRMKMGDTKAEAQEKIDKLLKPIRKK